jgi:hypothetical protein
MVELMQKGEQNDVSSVLRNTKITLKLYPEQNSRNADFRYSLNPLLRGSTRLKNFNWELFVHRPYIPEIVPRDYYLFT